MVFINTAHDSARRATPIRRYSLRLAAKKESAEEEKESLMFEQQLSKPKPKRRQTRTKNNNNNNNKQHAGKKRSAREEEEEPVLSEEEPIKKRTRTGKNKDVAEGPAVPKRRRTRNSNNNHKQHAGKKRSTREEEEPVLSEEEPVEKRRRTIKKKDATTTAAPATAPKKRKHKSGEESEQPSNKRQRRTRNKNTESSDSPAKPAKNLAAAKTPKEEVAKQQQPIDENSFVGENVRFNHYLEDEDFSSHDLDPLDLSQPWTSKDERFLKYYTGIGYTEANSALRMGVIPAKTQQRIDGVVGALDKLMHHKGSYKGWTYRGTNLPKEIAETLQPGSTFVDAGFASTSYKAAQAFGGNHLFMIKSKTGVNVEDHSGMKHEAEVLFRPGTSFKVLTVIKLEQVTLVTMEEIVDDEEASEKETIWLILRCLWAFSEKHAVRHVWDNNHQTVSQILHKVRDVLRHPVRHAAWAFAAWAFARQCFSDFEFKEIMEAAERM
jgi:hypothetical protein